MKDNIKIKSDIHVKVKGGIAKPRPKENTK